MPQVRPRVPDPAPVRPAPAGAAGAGRGASAAMDSGVATRPIAGHEARTRKSSPVHLPHRPADEAGVRPRAQRPQARGLRRRRRRNRAARGADGDRRGARAPDPDRPPRGDRTAHRAPGPAHARGRRFRTDQHQLRPALRRLLAAVPRADRTPRRHPGGGQEPAALAPHADRRADGRARRSRRDDLRPGRPLPQEARLPAQRVRLRARRHRHRRDDRRDQRPGRVVLPRHPRAVRPERRADRRSHAAGDLPPQAVRHRAQGRAALALQLRQPRQRVGGEDAQGLPDHPRSACPSSRSTAR